MKKINFLCQANPGEDRYNFSMAYKVNRFLIQKMKIIAYVLYLPTALYTRKVNARLPLGFNNCAQNTNHLKL